MVVSILPSQRSPLARGAPAVMHKQVADQIIIARRAERVESLSGSLRIDRVLARPPRPRTRKRRELTLGQSGRSSIYSWPADMDSCVIAFLRRPQLGPTQLGRHFLSILDQEESNVGLLSHFR